MTAHEGPPRYENRGGLTTLVRHARHAPPLHRCTACSPAPSPSRSQLLDRRPTSPAAAAARLGTCRQARQATRAWDPTGAGSNGTCTAVASPAARVVARRRVWWRGQCALSQRAPSAGPCHCCHCSPGLPCGRERWGSRDGERHAPADGYLLAGAASLLHWAAPDAPAAAAGKGWCSTLCPQMKSCLPVQWFCWCRFQFSCCFVVAAGRHCCAHYYHNTQAHQHTCGSFGVMRHAGRGGGQQPRPFKCVCASSGSAPGLCYRAVQAKMWCSMPQTRRRWGGYSSPRCAWQRWRRGQSRRAVCPTADQRAEPQRRKPSTTQTDSGMARNEARALPLKLAAGLGGR